MTRAVLAIVALVIVLGICAWFRPQIETNRRHRQRILELQQQISAQKDIARKLDNSFRALQDPKTIERLAREKLNYAKPGENVIHFETSTIP